MMNEKKSMTRWHVLAFWALGSLMVLAAPEARGLLLVGDGQAQAVVVVAEDARPVATYAAQELVEHIEKASGVRLLVVTEGQIPAQVPHRIFVGVTAAAKDRGLAFQALPADAFLLQVIGEDLFITGPEDGEDPMSEEPGSGSGTLYGVYEVLERFVGIRWLWPGELGTFVPKMPQLHIDRQLHQVVEPAYAYRMYRTHLVQQSAADYAKTAGRWHLPEVGFSEPVMKRYDRDLHIYKRRHRLGQTQPKPKVSHVFSNWWHRYGKQHPEWFRMDENGRRGPRDNSNAFQLRHLGLCYANPELQRFILDEHWDGGPELSLGDVDSRTFCLCPDCEAFNGPQPQDAPAFARRLYQPWITDRYVRFWQQFRKQAIQRNPQVLVTTYLYWNYLPAPSEEVDLSEGYYGEFVPWGQDTIAYWPMSAEADRWLRDQWLGWQKTGIRMVYRPNYFHGGYVMPHLSTRQVGSFLKFATEHGMEGVEQDSLYGHWSVRGPMLYLHMRLTLDPQLSIDAVLDEYYTAFGPAAEAVRAYFDFWEDYSARRRGNALFNPVLAHLAFPTDVLDQGAALLDAAGETLKATPEDSEYRHRLRFLELGLEHARLTGTFLSHLNAGQLPVEGPDSTARVVAARKALDTLRQFRRENEHTYFADLQHASWRENRYMPLTELLALDMERSQEASATPLRGSIPMTGWEFRKDPENRGWENAWFERGGTDAWQPVTVPQFWAHQPEIGDYQGYGWYRIRFEIPAQWRGEGLTLFFEGIDEQAWVFVNGRLIAEHTVTSESLPIQQLWNKPFEVVLPADALNSAGENELIVRVHNAVANGGIWAPVRLFGADDLN